MHLRTVTSQAALVLSAILFSSCGGSTGRGVLPLGPGDGNNDPAPSAGYLGGAVVQKSKLQLPGAGLGVPDANTEVGETVACMNETGELTHLEIYEYYEARELTSVNMSLGIASEDPWVRVADTLSKINHLDPELVTELIAFSNTLKASMRLLPSAKLLSYPMKDSIISLPANCFLLQAAMMNIDTTRLQYSFLVDKTIWEAMNSDQKAGLILHETLKLYYDIKFLVTSGTADVDSPRATAYTDGSSSRNTTDPVIMDHKLFRQAHIAYVDTLTGFRSFDFATYLGAIGALGHKSIKLGEYEYVPEANIEFYSIDERKVKKGALAKPETITSPSPLFKDITIAGIVSFYEDGALQSTVVGNSYASTTNGIPDQFYMYRSWPLANGGTGYVNGTMSFSEEGQFLAMEFGFLNQDIVIKTDRFDLVVHKNKTYANAMGGGSVRTEEVQSFNFLPGEAECRRCSGSILLESMINPSITFKNAKLRQYGSIQYEISEAAEGIDFSLADGAKLRAFGHLSLNLAGQVTSVGALQGVEIVCGNGIRVRMDGELLFSPQGKITHVGGYPISCSDYVYRSL